MRAFFWHRAATSGIRLQMVCALPSIGGSRAAAYFGGTIPMRRLGIMCLFLGLTAPAIAADPPASEETPSIPWYRWLFLGERAKPEAPNPEAEKPTAAARPKTPAASASTKEAIVRTMADEQKVYFERLQAITRIRQIAHDRNDEQLMRKADDLEQQAEDNFKMRTARLPTLDDDRAKLERGRDDGPATAARPTGAGRSRSRRGWMHDHERGKEIHGRHAAAAGQQYTRRQGRFDGHRSGEAAAAQDTGVEGRHRRYQCEL